MSRVAAALAEARAAGMSSLDAQLLLGRLLGLSRTGLVTAGDRPLSADEAARFAAWCARRIAGEPVAYLLGEKEFHGLLLEVTPDVLVPRPETELLVDWACALAEARKDRPTSIADLGTGSGAIALAVKHRQPRASVLATDTSLAALAVARRNAARQRLDVTFAHGSWWQAVAGRQFDIAVANPPYVAEGDPHLAVLQHEPRMALTPGGDGLAAISELVAGAAAHLSAGGWLLVEHGFDQAEPVRRRFAAAGFSAVETRADLAGHPRATGGRRDDPGPRGARG